MQVKIPDKESRSSASAETADRSDLAQAACDAESARIDSWTDPKFASGKNQAQLDASFGYKEKRTGK